MENNPKKRNTKGEMLASAKLRTEFFLSVNFGKTELQDYLGESYLTVSRWWTGDRLPDIDNLITLARHFQTNISFLLSLTDIPAGNQVYTVSSRIKEIRKSLGISQQKLADLCGLTSYISIAGYEKNGIPLDSSKSLATLWKMSCAFGCSLDYLLGLSCSFTWDGKEDKALSLYAPGTAVHISTKYISENALISKDGKGIILPDLSFIPFDDIRLSSPSVRVLK